MASTKLMFSVCLGLLVSGCAHHQHMSRDFGYSNHLNSTVQRVDPAAESRQHAALTADGQRTEAALERYRTEHKDATRDRVVTGISN